jgi:hypothetical protein
VRTWALDAIADGTLPIAQVKDGAGPTRALALATGTPLPVNEVAPQRLTPAAPHADGYMGQQDLEAAMARAIALRRR